MNPLSEIEKLKQRIQQENFLAGKLDSLSTISNLSKDASRLTRFFWQVVRSGRWVWQHSFGPIISKLMIPTKWVFWKYVDFWNKVVYYTDIYQVKHFSKIRGGIMAISTLLLVFWVLPITIGFTWDLGWYLTTVEHNEEVVLFDSQEIGGLTEDVHSIKGCHKVQIPCPDDSTVYYRARSHVFHHVWSLFTNGDLFYPDYVAAAVPPGY